MKPTLLKTPEQCPGSYDLHLYCKYGNPLHDYGEMPWEASQFQTYGEAATWARSEGWILHRDQTATCPKCRAALNSPADSVKGGEGG